MATHAEPMEEKRSTVAELEAKEYEAMRTLILEGIKETHTLERYTIVGVAAFWTWLFSQGEWREWMRWARFLPSVLIVLAMLRSWALLIFIMRIARYVHSIEPRFGLGWEHFIAQQKYWTMTIVAGIFWLVLLVACTVVGLAFDGSWLTPSLTTH